MIGSRNEGLWTLVAALFSSTLPLLAQEKPPIGIEREVDFVLGLAKEMRFISLAQSLVEEMQTSNHSPSDQDKIAQAGITVAFYGAKTTSDRAQQRQRYKETIEKSRALLDRSSDPKVQALTRATLADACQEFGQFLNDEIEIAQTEDPDRVKELEDEAGSVFKWGVEACDKVMDDLAPAARKNRNGPEAIERGVMWLRKGILLREQGRAVKADRGFLVDRAKSVFEELVFEYGEETALGLRGLFELAQCDEILGKKNDAAERYRDTVRQITTALEDKDGTLGLNADTQALLFNMQQQVTARLADLLFESGDTEGCAAVIAGFEQNLAKFGEQGLDILDVADPRYGHLTLLVKCRLLAESGDAKGVRDALDLAKRINDKGHANDLVGVKAKGVIKEILTAHQDLVSGKLLFEVAKGDYQNKEYEKAIQGLRRALAAMTDSELAEQGAEAYTMLGLSFAYSERMLEAVIAFGKGLERVGKAKDPATEKLAEWLDKATSQLNALTKKDPAFAELTAASEALVRQYGSEAQGDPRHWQKGDEAMRAAQLATDPKERAAKAREAVAEYRAITKDFLRYEEARVRVAVALTMAGDLEGAQKVIDDYRAWLQTEEAVLDPSDSGKQQVRGFALAEADFREAVLLYDRATDAAGNGSAKDLTLYAAAIEKLNAFLANHEKDASDQLIAFALDRLGRLHSARGELDKAEEMYARLKAKDPQGGAAARLATVIFDDYLTVISNLEAELDKANNENKDSATISAIAAQLRTARQKLANLGAEYMRSSAKPQIGIMVHTMNQYEALKDWRKVSETAQKILSVHGDATDRVAKDTVDMVVRPKIGEALLEQHEFERAYQMLIEAEKANPRQWELKRLIARALGGWFFFDERTGQPRVQPGLGRPVEAYEKYWNEYRPWGLRPEVKEYSLEWYRFYWECYWYAHEAAAKDSKYMEYARTLFSKAQSIDDFATLDKLGQKGKELHSYFKLNRVK